jgi:hypothetical protein
MWCITKKRKMKNLLKNENYVAIGLGVLTFAVVGYLLNRRNRTTSSFEGDYFEPSSNYIGDDYFEPSIK